MPLLDIMLASNFAGDNRVGEKSFLVNNGIELLYVK